MLLFFSIKQSSAIYRNLTKMICNSQELDSEIHWHCRRNETRFNAQVINTFIFKPDRKLEIQLNVDLFKNSMYLHIHVKIFRIHLPLIKYRTSDQCSSSSNLKQFKKVTILNNCWKDGFSDNFEVQQLQNDHQSKHYTHVPFSC